MKRLTHIFITAPLLVGFLIAASEKPLEVLWNDPGPVEQLDFEGGPGGRFKAPRPPFAFVREELSGTTAKIYVTDVAGATWVAKWGSEGRAEVFASRLVWAAGYFASPTYWVPVGQITGIHGLTRAKSWVQRDGTFVDARFKLEDPPRLKGHDWAFTNNPFMGTRELNGLKILLMLTSNWDSKDARDIDQNGSNTAIFQRVIDGNPALVYAFTDWGASMGKWGGVMSRSKWNCTGYSEQSADLVKGVNDSLIEWGYKGQHTQDVAGDIPISDVRWLLQYIGRISDEQIQAGLQASGATPEDVTCFSRAIRNRLDQLHRIAGTDDAKSQSPEHAFAIPLSSGLSANTSAWSFRAVTVSTAQISNCRPADIPAQRRPKRGAG